MTVVAGPGAGALRHRVHFERRDPNAGGDGAGNFVGEWKPLCGPRPASLTPKRGGDQVIADRLQGVAVFDLWVRYDDIVARVQAGDRVVDANDPDRQFAVRWANDIDGRRRWILMQIEQGTAT